MWSFAKFTFMMNRIKTAVLVGRRCRNAGDRQQTGATGVVVRPARPALVRENRQLADKAERGGRLVRLIIGFEQIG